MIVIMKTQYSREDLTKVLERVSLLGFEANILEGSERTLVGVLGDTKASSLESLSGLEGVDKVIRITKPFKLSDKDKSDAGHLIKVGDVSFDSKSFPVIAGPCAIENEQLSLEIAREVKRCGARIFRGGAFKPRTSPYSYQGLGRKGLEILSLVRKETDMPIITEVMDARDLDLVSAHADILQIGARNMQNFMLLKEVGRSKMPVVLKRGMMASIEEWMMAAEYILLEGNTNIILCERGIRTYETMTRNTLDLSAVACAKNLTHLPVIVDPSHATGRWDLIAPMTLAGLAAGADGAMIEVHPDPDQALCDGAQSLKYKVFESMMTRLKEVAPVFNRRI